MAGFQFAAPGSSPWAGLGRRAAECLAGPRAPVVCLGLSPPTPALGTLLSVNPVPELLALNLSTGGLLALGITPGSVSALTGDIRAAVCFGSDTRSK